MQKKKILIAAGALAAAALLIYLILLLYLAILKRRKSSSAGASSPQDSGAGSGSTSTSTSADAAGSLSTFPLKWGAGSSRSSSPDEAKQYVKGLQRICNYYGADLTVDGIWGDKTEAAVDNLKKLTLTGNEGSSQPYNRYITPVAVPLSSASMWQVTRSNYDSMARYFNSI